MLGRGREGGDRTVVDLDVDGAGSWDPPIGFMLKLGNILPNDMMLMEGTSSKSYMACSKGTGASMAVLEFFDQEKWLGLHCG